jgi:hypothetical protein
MNLSSSKGKVGAADWKKLSRYWRCMAKDLILLTKYGITEDAPETADGPASGAFHPFGVVGTSNTGIF